MSWRGSWGACVREWPSVGRLHTHTHVGVRGFPECLREYLCISSARLCIKAWKKTQNITKQCGGRSSPLAKPFLAAQSRFYFTESQKKEKSNLTSSKSLPPFNMLLFFSFLSSKNKMVHRSERPLCSHPLSSWTEFEAGVWCIKTFCTDVTSSTLFFTPLKEATH